MRTLYKHIIFDLDGTLSDSREGLFNAYEHVFQKIGFLHPGKEMLTQLIGPSLQKGFSEILGLAHEQVRIAVEAFREYYGSKGLYENHLYDGIELLIKDLKKYGGSLYLATAKYHPFAQKIMHHFSLSPYFTDMAGADYEGLHARKTDLIASILQRNNIRDPFEVVVIGDTQFDIGAAEELDIDSIGVAYGFTPLEEMKTMNPDYIVQSVSELYGLLIIP
jgi:phosphoglycolate phosphatase